MNFSFGIVEFEVIGLSKSCPCTVGDVDQKTSKLCGRNSSHRERGCEGTRTECFGALRGFHRTHKLVGRLS